MSFIEMDGADFLCSINPKFAPYKHFLKNGVHLRLERLDKDQEYGSMEKILNTDKGMFHFLQLHTEATTPTFKWNWVNEMHEEWEKKYDLN